MRHRSRLGFFIGLACAVIGVVGYVFLGWRFGGATEPVAVVIALIAVAAAIVVTVRRSGGDL